MRIATSQLLPSQPSKDRFPKDADLLVVQLETNLRGAARVDCEIRSLEAALLMELPDVPFEETGVQLACQKRFADIFPPVAVRVTVFRVEEMTRRPVADFLLTHFAPPE
jgi:hypothetical protein